MSAVANDDVVHIVTIEGGIGVGKSTAMEKLKSRVGKSIHFIDEPVKQWEDTGLLDALYSKTINPACFQIAALCTRMAPLLKAVREGHRLIVTERCPWSDIETFTKANLDENSIEFTAYQMSFDSLMTAMPTFKLHIIYLHAPVKTLLLRINKRNRRAERTENIEQLSEMHEYLEKLQVRHDAFFHTELATSRKLINAEKSMAEVHDGVLDAVNDLASFFFVKK